MEGTSFVVEDLEVLWPGGICGFYLCPSRPPCPYRPRPSPRSSHLRLMGPHTGVRYPRGPQGHPAFPSFRFVLETPAILLLLPTSSSCSHTYFTRSSTISPHATPTLRSAGFFPRTSFQSSSSHQLHSHIFHFFLVSISSPCKLVV